MQSNHLKPNKVELQLGAPLQSLCPGEFKYVGNGRVIIDGYCPDFFSCNGKKKIIELFGDYWHSERAGRPSKEEEEKQRINRFA